MEALGYGVTRLSMVPVRGEPADAAEMTSQLLFGEHYTVLEESEDRKWLKVVNAFDSYEGWIDRKQHHSISKEYYRQISETEYKICTDLVAKILFKQQINHIVAGSILPLLNNPIFKEEENVAFNGTAKSMHQKWGVATLLNHAEKYLNSPYLWGGRSPFGIDCSGFTQVVFRTAGYTLPRDSSQQIAKGKEVDFADRKAGDLVFFTNSNGKMNHVGLLTEPDRIIHASGKVRIDVFDQKGIKNLEQNTYTHHFFKLKRIIT
ncbi:MULTISPECIES: C40 family peptidase [Roseivirga]|uniref:C40 family peptidase n=1 Tax=Roseivirga TaxID=290180 RepID=UPI00257BE20A|nr:MULTISPECIES: C40 family peptidase [Roseivirga]|tara:strand:- start:28279 stop:29064 length:786 start_codon:yes stop_codon:yes gene_type:complete